MEWMGLIYHLVELLWLHLVLELVHLLEGSGIENVLSAVVDDSALEVGVVSFDAEE